MSPTDIIVKVSTTDIKRQERFEYFIENIIKNKIPAANKINIIFGSDVQNPHYIFIGSHINEIDSLPNIINGMSKNETTFIIIDGCTDVSFDSDDEIIFDDENIQEKISSIQKLAIDLENIHLLCISSIYLLLLSQYSDEKTIANMSDKEITILSNLFGVKTAKLDKAEKYRQIERKLKNTDINSFLRLYGYDGINDIVMPKFKIIAQKAIVRNNYVKMFENIKLLSESVSDVINTYNSILSTKLFKEQQQNQLEKSINKIIGEKITYFIESYKSKIQFDTNAKVLNTLDPHKYHECITQLINISTIDQTTRELLQTEINRIDKMIIDYHNSKMKNIHDLTQISNLLEIYAKKDPNSLTGLINELLTNENIHKQNIMNNRKWISFIDKLIELKINREDIIGFVEKIIRGKISYYCSQTGLTGKTIDFIYPQCLNVFLIGNINKGFIFKRLYIYLNNMLRYSGRGTEEFIKNITEEQYYELISFEQKLVELNRSPTDMSSQLDMSDVDIVESYATANDTEKYSKKRAAHRS